MLGRGEVQQSIEEYDRLAGRESLFHFSRFCLGYSLMKPKPHKDVCGYAESIVREHKKGLDLEPRGSFKTTVFSQSLPTWLIVRDPNIRILLDSQVLQNSIDNLQVVKNHVQDPHFKFLFGDHEGEHWTLEAFTSKMRTRRDLKEPTIRCASPERVQVGPHYDVIIADDLVSKDNSMTPEQREKIKDHFKLLFSLLEPDGILIVIGTRWHYDDLYGMIIDKYPQFKRRIINAEKDGVDGGLYFPERLTRAFLDDQLINLGREFYNSQYLNDPAPEGKDSAFQREWFKPYVDVPKLRYGFIAIDPGGEKKGSDEWAIMAAYCDDKNDLYFDKLIRGNWRTDVAWDILFSLVEIVDPITVGLEVTGGQKYLLESLQDEMRRRGRFFNVAPLTHAQDSKEYRILRLQPRYQCGAIYHSPNMGPLEDQLRRFPKGKDDVADVASMILEISVGPRHRRSKLPPPKGIDDLIWRAMLPGKHQKVWVHPSLGSEC